MKFAADQMADAAETADDVMITEFADTACQFSPPEDFSKLAFKGKLKQAAEGVGDHACTADNQNDGE